MNPLQELLDRYQRGDSAAPGELLNLYAARLVALARSRIQGRLRRRLDADDIAQSALGSFFRRASAGGYQVADGDDLWPLLATITINKLRKKIDYHHAGKRALDVEESITSGGSVVTFLPAALAHEPEHEEQILLTEELDAVFSQLEPVHQEIVNLILAGESVSEVAERVNRTERTVRRVRERVHAMLSERLRS